MIIGLTDKIIIRRAGKIRAGYREESGKMVNTPYFLIHDAPQLIPVLGEKPTEIYFTVVANRSEEFFRDDLRWYGKSELMCVSTHERGKSPTAAYLAFGDAAGVKQTAHPRFPKARERACLYKNCPQYLEGKCGEHFFLDMIIPQYSLGPVFQLDNTSKLAIINIHAAIEAAKRECFQKGMLQGEIFRIFKKEIPVSFTDVEKAKKFNRDQAVIHLEHIPFKIYEEKFRDKIDPDTWAGLIGLRSGAVRTEYAIAAGEEVPELEVGAATRAALPSPNEQADLEKAILDRANNPTVVKLLDQLGALVGKPNTEEMRVQLARMVSPTLEGLVDYIQGRIAKEKKKAKEDAEPIPQPIGKEAAPAAANGSLF